jgi:AbrB family looped-hinge helix DNA binding protein
MIITIDRAGRIVVPKPIRDRFHLVPGTTLELQAGADGIRLFPVSNEPSLVSKQGVLVHHGPGTTEVDIRQVIDQVRANRDADLVGERPNSREYNESAP